MQLELELATHADAAEVAAVRPNSTVRAVELALARPKFSRILIARDSARRIVGTLNLVTKKPWAIDTKYFTPVPRPLYLISMAVHPDFQRHGVGRRLMEEAKAHARSWPADAIRLDADNSPAGAGLFYSKCGYREVARVAYKGHPLVYFELLLSPIHA